MSPPYRPALAAAIAAIALGACSVQDLPPEDPTATARGACTTLEGLTFRSVNPGECGLTPDGVALCHWSIRFESAALADRSGFEWSHSDVAEGGWVACDGASLSTVSGFSYSGQFDESTMTLTWDSAAYELAP